MIFFHFYLFADFSFGIKYINSIALVVIFLSEREREEKWIRNPNYEFANIFFSLGRNLLTRSGDNYLENILRFLNYDFFSCLSVCLLVCLFAQLWSLSFAFCSFGPNWEIEFPVHEQSWVDRERKKKDEKKERERKRRKTQKERWRKIKKEFRWRRINVTNYIFLKTRSDGQ